MRGVSKGAEDRRGNIRRPQVIVRLSQWTELRVSNPSLRRDHPEKFTAASGEVSRDEIANPCQNVLSLGAEEALWNGVASKSRMIRKAGTPEARRRTLLLP